MDKKIKRVVINSLGPTGSQLDPTIVDYISSILQEETADFQDDGEELCEVVSPLLLDTGCAKEDQVLEICRNIINQLHSEGLIKKKASTKTTNKSVAILNAPVRMSNLSNPDDSKLPEWMKQQANISIVDTKALEAAKAKTKLKSEKRAIQKEKKKKQYLPSEASSAYIQRANEISGVAGGAVDVKIDNISLSYGKVELISNANLTLAYGRHYGLVGRNGSGKSTLMRAIAERTLSVPKNLQILHVEQEVMGDEITVLQNVLSADKEREDLLTEEVKLQEVVSETSTAPVTEKSDASFKLQRIYNRLQIIDAYTAESRARTILAGLGFTQEMQDQPSREFSGGWRMRVALARALFIQPDILLLDEPTNHLDLFATLWLENYLSTWKKTLLIVSHQREFLNNVATDIIHLTQKTLSHYKGNYDNFEKIAGEKFRQQQRKFDAQQAQRKHIQKFIDRFRYNAKRATMAQSRIKKLEKMQLVSEVVEEEPVRLVFPDPSDNLSPPILQLVDAGFKYASNQAPVFSDLNMNIDMQSRIALVGPNGSGKSTLLKLLSGELNPTSGMVLRNPKVRFSQFSQHFVDQLDLTMSALEYFHSHHSTMAMQDIRSHLGSFGLSGDLALRTMSALSGGQKSRVVFAMMAKATPHILLLDEPSNHLDIETIEGLARSLTTYQGGVLLVSHDERLITLVCDEIWKIDNGRVLPFEGDFEDYKNSLIQENSFVSLPKKYVAQE
eukprot:TRINITY_DN3154_c0_g2_i1.p1 TRINITY_DN3154_c0_g2~~TRINITY_DN3154_c0_g2_i1.p1  ORF type:complete len:729 (+),score=198.26 TRINITY_DN3154_c0_g2_i1:104-2290(+)